MTPEAIEALHAWIAGRETYMMPAIGDAQITSTPDGPVIDFADQHIGVTLELAEDAADGYIDFAVETAENGKPTGVLTLRATNRTIRYQVISYVLPWKTLICDRIDEAD